MVWLQLAVLAWNVNEVVDATSVPAPVVIVVDEVEHLTR